MTSDIVTAGQVVAAVGADVVGSVARESARLQASWRTGVTEEQWRATVGRLVHASADPSADDRFDFVPARLLDGLASCPDDPQWTTGAPDGDPLP
ncbi:hypothetical protein [Actinosynnema sp. NPDC020468]|uniref:hypothetical protein n=1 Tax=Actinosynnema sp. NPDC020468 TaxID=3154488 RepID=UPI0033DF6C98